MDRYGLTEEEKRTHLQQYNHALFQNSLSFMDMVWEINTRLETIVVLEDKARPDTVKCEFSYPAFLQAFLDRYVQPDDDPQILFLENLKALEEERSVDLHLLMEDGNYHLHKAALTPAFDEAGSQFCVYLGALDLHEEEEKERANQQYQSQFRQALVDGSYFHFELDLDTGGMIEHEWPARDGTHPISDAVKKPFPFPYKDWVDAWYEQYEPEFDIQQAGNIFTVGNFRKCWENNERLLNLEVKQKSMARPGHYEYMHIFVALMENPADGHVHACVVWRDITPFRQGILENKAHLQAKNEQLQKTVSEQEQFRLASLSGAILVYNINLTKNLVEEEFYEIVDGRRIPMLKTVGLSAPCPFDLLIQAGIRTRVSEDSLQIFDSVFSREHLLECYARGEVHQEFEFESILGRNIPLILRHTVLLVEDPDSLDIIAMVSVKDVTEQRRKEQEQWAMMQAAYDTAIQANTAKSEFLSRMSHDIRTPMNAITGMTTLAKKHLDDPVRLLDCLEKIETASAHLVRLLNDVLDMSKIESGKMSLSESDVNLEETVDAALQVLLPLAHAKHQEVKAVVNVQDDCIFADGQRLEQIILNLAGNAVKYTPENGHVSIALLQEPVRKPGISKYKLVVADDGIGMSPEFVKRIFEPFERSGDIRARSAQGTGLGMPIVRSLVEMMGGTIKIDSEPEKGTTVTVTLFFKNRTEQKLRIVPQESTPERRYPGYRALLAEDNSLNAEIALELFSMMDLEADWACNGQEAVDMYRENPDRYDVVFMDIQMPQMNGYQAAAGIREMDRQVPILAMSADAFLQDVELARQAGMNAHIAKPIRMDELKKTMAAWIGKKID